MHRVLFIGLGHMGGALASSAANKLGSDWEVYGFDKVNPNQESLAKRASRLKFLSSLSEIKNIDFNIIVLGIRPIDFGDLANELKAFNLNNKILVSMVNALTIDQMSNHFDNDSQIAFIRMMPNMNAIISESMTALATKNGSTEQMALVKTLFLTAGKVIEISENKIPTFAAIAGCMPSYIFTFYLGAVDYAKKHGFNHQEAMEIVGQAIIGSVKNAQQSEFDLPTLIKQIGVPNGSTIAGQEVLDKEHFIDILQSALLAANKKA